MTAPPVNSDEDYYMDESFDEESLSEVEDEPEEDVQEESDSRSDSDVEAEFLRGNPHARRQQIFGKGSGGGSGFPRDKMMIYNSSSEDEAQVIIRKTVVEVNQSKQYLVQMDDETLSDRTVVPNGNPEDSDLTEIGDYDDVQMEDEVGEEEEIEYEVEYDDNGLVSDHSNDEQDDEVEIGQFEDEEQENQNAMDKDKSKPGLSQSDLVDIVDCGSEIGSCSGESDAEKCSPENTDNEMEYIPVPIAQKQKRLPKTFPKLNRKPILPTPFEKSVDTHVPPLPKLEDALDDNGAEFDGPDCMGMGATDQFNVKFLEQQMTQMSEMIMKTFRLSGGAADNNAFEQLAMATKLMQKQGKKLSELEEEPESISTVESPKTPTTVRSEILRNSKCRCPSITDDNEPEEESFSMDECGQGDGLMRYPHMQQTQSKRINCRVSSVTPTSFNSDNCGYHVDIRRPRSTTSSEKVNYKNLGRKSFSFTNPQVREIERANNILLKKMMNVKPTIKAAVNGVKSSSNVQAKNQTPPAPRLTSAAVNRKKYQRQIDLDNDVLKRKLEAVGSRRPLFK
ncbi:protein hemingway [Drosophila innubila]|uniref:protein hemingway n=1 Tax=Drosophila innubila TaxID=198719 RepID=UPI00148DF6F0|nr:protein hemingway [Drosophila innubila]